MGKWLVNLSDEVEAADIISFSVFSKEVSSREIFFMVYNELTEATALGFLHFMRHLSWDGGSCLSDVRFLRGASALNWGLIQPDGSCDGQQLQLPTPPSTLH